jgi:tRNA1Val (adenine37-N6)-methyltransferase
LSSTNAHPTFLYSQPTAYRFSHDSVFLARAIFERHADRLCPRTHVLDLCAGCGIVGLDFLFHCREELGITPFACDFVEIQKAYALHFAENVNRLGETACKLNFIIDNYTALLAEPFREKYDLVMCNPPYFRLGQGKLSSSEFKNRCRFFLDSDFTTLVKAVCHSLKPTGTAYLLLRSLNDHGLNPLAEARMELASSAAIIEIVGDIRGTDLMRIMKVKH